MGREGTIKIPSVIDSSPPLNELGEASIERVWSSKRRLRQRKVCHRAYSHCSLYFCRHENQQCGESDMTVCIEKRSTNLTPNPIPVPHTVQRATSTTNVQQSKKMIIHHHTMTASIPPKKTKDDREKPKCRCQSSRHQSQVSLLHKSSPDVGPSSQNPSPPEILGKRKNYLIIRAL